MTPEGRSVFSLPALQPYVDEAIGLVPPGKRGALVAFVDVDGSAELRFVSRLFGTDQWTVSGIVRREPAGAFTGRVQVVGSW